MSPNSKWFFIFKGTSAKCLNHTTELLNYIMIVTKDVNISIPFIYTSYFSWLSSILSFLPHSSNWLNILPLSYKNCPAIIIVHHILIMKAYLSFLCRIKDLRKMEYILCIYPVLFLPVIRVYSCCFFFSFFFASNFTQPSPLIAASCLDFLISFSPCWNSSHIHFSKWNWKYLKWY